MPALSCDVKYAGSMITSSVYYSQSAWRAAIKDVWGKVGWHLFENFVGKHFTKPGADEYRDGNMSEPSGPVYQARSGEGESGRAFWKSYNGRKQKQTGSSGN